MESEIDGVLRVFHSLTDTQRAEAVRKLDEYLRGSQETRERLLREAQWHEWQEVRKIDVGPIRRVCPYCGK